MDNNAVQKMTQKTKIEQYDTHPQIQKPKLGGGGVNACAP